MERPSDPMTTVPYRPIRFRIWDVTRKEMLSWDDTVWLQTKIASTLPEAPSELNAQLAETWLPVLSLALLNESNRQFIPMQYTGVDDETGKPIYEGDIMEGSNGDPESPSYYRWVVRWDAPGGAWSVDEVFQGDEALLSTAPGCDRVVGNVYESPNLLETGEES